MLIILASALFLFYLVGIVMILCPKTKAISQGELEGRTDVNRPMVSMYGYYYEIKDVFNSHVNTGKYLNDQAFKATTLYIISNVADRMSLPCFTKRISFRRFALVLRNHLMDGTLLFDRYR